MTDSREPGEVLKPLRSPMDRYHSDTAFASLVDMMLAYIVAAKYTPSEMREAAMIASIRYEMMFARRQHWLPDSAAHQLSSELTRLWDEFDMAAMRGEI